MIVVSLVTPKPSKANDERVKTFFAAQGCAIGPSTIAAAIADGNDLLTIEAYVATTRIDPKTVKTGDWLISFDGGLRNSAAGRGKRNPNERS